MLVKLLRIVLPIIGLSTLVFFLVHSGLAPAVQWRLAQSVKSLPAAPPTALLLAEREGSQSGSDCNAYNIDQVYGVQHPLGDVVAYYQEKLTMQGWKQLRGESPGGWEAAVFSRQPDEFVSILTERHMDFTYAIQAVEAAQLKGFETAYILRVTRMCHAEIP